MQLSADAIGCPTSSSDVTSSFKLRSAWERRRGPRKDAKSEIDELCGASPADAAGRAGDECEWSHRGDDTLSRVEPAGVQRVCPHCARISYADGRQCPYCGRSFRRAGLWPIAAMLAVFAAVVLGGVALMFLAAGREVERQLDSEVKRVERNFGRDFERDFDAIRRDVRRDLRRELERRLPPVSAVP